MTRAGFFKSAATETELYLTEGALKIQANADRFGFYSAPLKNLNKDNWTNKLNLTFRKRL